MARALYADISNRGAVQGGSTITQQFVKNAYLTSQKSVGRKLFEAALAWQLEQKWTKDRILTAYLNTVYFGNGAYGVEQASRIYFHHRARTLNPAESALLAGDSRGPELVGPGSPSTGGARPARPRAAPAAGAGLPHTEPVRQVERVSDARSEGRRVAVDAGNRRPVLRELRQGTARQPLRAGTHFRRRPQGDDHAQRRHAADGARRDRVGSPSERNRPDRGRRRARCAYRRGTRDGRRGELPPQSVQSRDAGRAAAGLLVQAVRARDGIAARTSRPRRCSPPSP